MKTNLQNSLFSVSIILASFLFPSYGITQETISLAEVNDIILSNKSDEARPIIPWWQNSIKDSINNDSQRIETHLNQLLQLAVANSAKINVARHIPEIRQTSIIEASADFDWTAFIDSNWKDSSDPVGSQLTVGGTGTRFRDHHLTANAGLRKKLDNGATIDFTQESGHQNNNSTFFIPNNQATSRLVLGYTQPLLQGNGRQYNTSLIMIANIDVESANEEFRRQLQSHLLEVTRSYWSLYLERATLAQKIKLYKRTKRIHDQIMARLKVDAQRSQFASVSAALESRKADLIRAVAAVKNAETRIRSLINVQEMNNPALQEIIPIEHPVTQQFQVDLASEFANAVSNRPEIRSSLNSIQSAAIRLDLAKNEILPKLNLVTQMYVAGLRGNSDISNSFLDQFKEGEPSYSIGLQYEINLGRRAANARASRRELEVSQLQEEYRNTMELVRAEVEVAVREIETSYRELMAKNRARIAAEQEAETLEVRWRSQVDVVSAGLSLESLLQSQERVSNAEQEFSKAQLTYNLAMVNLRHATGTLLAINESAGSVPVTMHQEQHSAPTLQVPTHHEEQSVPIVPAPEIEPFETAPVLEPQDAPFNPVSQIQSPHFDSSRYRPIVIDATTRNPQIQSSSLQPVVKPYFPGKR